MQALRRPREAAEVGGFDEGCDVLEAGLHHSSGDYCIGRTSVGRNRSWCARHASVRFVGMTNTSRGSSPARRVLIGTLATFGLTAVHHIYGGVIYHTPWRHHGAAAAAMLGGLAYALYVLHRRGRSWAGWTLSAVALVAAVAIFGVFEGAYNHVLKNVLYFGHAPRGVLVRLFPSPRYELPNDALFEITGVAQVVPAALAAAASFSFVRALRRAYQDRVGRRGATRDLSATSATHA